MSFDWQAYRSKLDPSEVIWEDAGDLARLSIGAFAAEQSPMRRDLSSGFLRLAGPGVTGHSAPVDEVAKVMGQFQRLILASGLSLSGWKTLRGRAPADVVSKTKLHLDGSALPGSLVLQVVPASLPRNEIMPSGQGEFFRENDNQLVDDAVNRSIDLLNMGKALEADADSTPFLAEVEDAGPRVGAAIRDFTAALVEGAFETELMWTQPRTPARRSRLSVQELVHIGALVASRALAREPVVLVGVLRTVSDISPLKIEIAPNEVESINAEAISGEVIALLRVGVRVRIAAEVTEDVAPGGDVKTHYRATQIEVLGE